MDYFLFHSVVLPQDFLISSKIIPSTISNHIPILLVLEYFPNYDALDLIFNLLWFWDENMIDVISNAWCAWIVGSPFYIWE
jgi:hypothetical protein